jgi:biopolymer transport protein ExbD
MSRRKHSRKAIELELFPFLSVLVCTIGTLILLIIVVTAQILGNQRQVTIVAKSENGQNKSKNPRYIECQKDGIIIHPSQKFVSRQEIGISNSVLEKLLVEMSERREREYLIIAVRPDGIDVFKEVRRLVEQKNIDIGFEPIDEGWRLKLKDLPSRMSNETTI